MDYDTYDMKAEAKAYYADKAREAEDAKEDARLARIERCRIAYMMTHGSDLGFDAHHESFD